MNWEVIGSYLPLYWKAMLLTLRIGWIGIAFAILIGILVAIVRFYKVPVASQIAGVYIDESGFLRSPGTCSAWRLLYGRDL